MGIRWEGRVYLIVHFRKTFQRNWATEQSGRNSALITQHKRLAEVKTAPAFIINTIGIMHLKKRSKGTNSTNHMCMFQTEGSTMLTLCCFQLLNYI